MNREIIDKLTEQIKTCHTCGKKFLGIAIKAQKEDGNYPIYLELEFYPLKCGLCPECAEICYQSKSFECKTKDEQEDLEVSELNCYSYLEANYQIDQLMLGGDLSVGALYDLLTFFRK